MHDIGKLCMFVGMYICPMYCKRRHFSHDTSSAWTALKSLRKVSFSFEQPVYIYIYIYIYICNRDLHITKYVGVYV